MLDTLGQLIKDVYMGDGQSVLVFELQKKWSCSQHRTPRYDRWEYICGHYECEHEEHYQLVERGCEECHSSDWVPVEPLKLNARLTGGMKWQLEQELIFMKHMVKDDLSRTGYGE